MAARDLVNVLDPALVAATSIGGQTDQLDASLGELGLELGKGAKLGGADGGEVFRVREENNPTVATNSWKSMGPLVVSAWKLGAIEPRRRLHQRVSRMDSLKAQYKYFRKLTVQLGSQPLRLVGV